jgi:putative transposase
MRQPYPSDLSDAEWAVLAPLVPAVHPGGRPRKHADRDLLDAMLYVLRGGIAWRALPHEYPTWQTVYHYFRLWRLDGSWERLNAHLCATTRVRAGRSPEPSAAILDSQSAKTTEKGGPGAGTGPRR